jgi:enoyl-CoA hydratase
VVLFHSWHKNAESKGEIFMSENSVLFEEKNNIATITLNRPEKRNCMNQSLLANLYDCVERFSNDEKLTVAILTGNGKSFCAGLDLNALLKENLSDPRGDGRGLSEVMSACHKPIIGAINGHSITGGFELALLCDFLIASDNASFRDSHVEVGIHPGWGMTQLLQQSVGQRMAKQISLTCEQVSAQRAFEIGLVNEVVSPENLLPRAFELARMIVSKNLEMSKTVKYLIEYRNKSTLEEALLEERKGNQEFKRKVAEMMRKS